MKLETIKVECGDGFMIINASDFDPAKHTKYGERKTPVKAPAKWARKKKRKAD